MRNAQEVTFFTTLLLLALCSTHFFLNEKWAALLNMALMQEMAQKHTKQSGQAQEAGDQRDEGPGARSVQNEAMQVKGLSLMGSILTFNISLPSFRKTAMAEFNLAASDPGS